MQIGMSYGRCEGCNRYGINVAFLYNGFSLVPDYMCPECFSDFERAMEDAGKFTQDPEDFY